MAEQPTNSPPSLAETGRPSAADTANTACLPTDAVLLDALRRLVAAKGTDPVDVALLARRPNPTSSTYLSEIVTVAVAGEERQLFLKHDIARIARPDRLRDHRGVRYEAEVYSRLLQPLALGTPRPWGEMSMDSASSCLALDFIPAATRVSKVATDQAMVSAARWLGAFHARTALPAATDNLAILPRIDKEMLGSVMHEAAATLQRAGVAPSWWPDLQEAWDRLTTPLLSSPPCAIHGEFYPENVLCAADAIHPIDWESAAVGPGEIDLACLTLGWSDEMRQRCVDAYVTERWRGVEPPGFGQRLAAAQALCYLENIVDWPLHATKLAGRLESWLGTAHSRLGLQWTGG